MTWLEIISWAVFGIFLLWMILPLTIYFCTRMGVLGFRRGKIDDISKRR